MALTPDSGGGVGGSGDSVYLSGSAASMCAINPSDLVGTLDNLITRIENLEKAVTQLLATNIWTNQLSDLSQQIGWVGGITYMGIDGWTQTEYGTLIPPAGFTLLGNGITLSDGNTYQAVVMGEDGVLQYGFGQTGPDGTFTPVSGTMASGQNIAIIESDDPIQAATTSNSTTTAVLHLKYDPANLIDLDDGDSTFQVTQTGIYYISATLTMNAYNAAGGVCWLDWNITGQPASYGVNRADGVSIYLQSRATASNPASQSAGKIVQISSSALHSISTTFTHPTSSTTFIIGGVTIVVQLLKAL